MKSWLAMSDVVASNPPTLIWAPLPNSMPLGLSSQTWPLARMAPLMVEMLGPVTRLRVSDEDPGWLNWTAAPAPTEKSCQLMMALLVAWLMMVVAPAVETCAWPAITDAPTGWASTRT